MTQPISAPQKLTNPIRVPALRRTLLILRRVPLYVIIIAVSLLWLFPFYSVVITSLKTQAEMFTTTLWRLPAVPQLKNFSDAWELIKVGMRNSMIITVTSTVFVVAIGALASYPLGRLKFPGRDWIYLIILGSFTIPYASMMPTLVHLLDRMHLLGTLPGIIIIHVAHGQPFVILMLARFFAAVPEEIIEAAILDGASPWTVFVRIMLPLTRPALAAVAIIAFTWIWSDYFKALTIVPQNALTPVTVSLAALTGQYTGQHHLRSAAALIAMAPCVIVFLCFHRSFIEGLTVGAIKG
jgi:ABC-type glycerol-3-phosphate transport system permease component